MPRLLLLAICLFGMPAPADESPLLGEPVDAETLARIDYTILPNGDGLPDGSGTARDGAAVYAQHCIACHGMDGEGTVNDRLVG
ncbi:MAG: c-type cytochrome, partial [Gammaproteobacteria bacterium]|nr:c-type cytochrome [Gammaproteobacteria bacterium]